MELVESILEFPEVTKEKSSRDGLGIYAKVEAVVVKRVKNGFLWETFEKLCLVVADDAM